eukprot:TRINITY_DN5272_c0_g1_i1.p1 TRINITY_DN5272_c0_g1~~TRINITY_DN5272_c0_g1_i1.p1  ORF type:complete len:278 (+),score=50.20 TRINITY_DN5272_c0_g1_i1:30-863(+)
MLSRLPLRYYSKVAMLSHAAMLTLAFGQTSAQILEVRSAPGFLVAQERTSVVVEADEPPVFAKRFNMNFKEESSMRRTSFPFTVDTKHNDGSFHYDFDNRREVWVHGKGQGDNWCQCAGTNTDDECHLKSVPSKDQPGGGALYVVMPAINKCCKVGSYSTGFGPLVPNWLRLSNATRAPRPQKVDTRTCTVWAAGPPGDTFSMVSDDWSFDEQGLPCAYTDHFKKWTHLVLGLSHTINFDKASYSEGAEHEDVFALPAGMSCEETCPNKQGWCRGGA